MSGGPVGAQDELCPRCASHVWTATEDRRIGHVIHDLIQFWSCPDCGGTWSRFSPESPRFPIAEQLRAEYDLIAELIDASRGVR